jgi:hypothetical protein
MGFNLLFIISQAKPIFFISYTHGVALVSLLLQQVFCMFGIVPLTNKGTIDNSILTPPNQEYT